MAGDALTSAEYIRHHLTNMTFGQRADGSWGIAHDAAEAAEMGFWAIHVDTMFWSILLGVLWIDSQQPSTTACPTRILT